MEFGIHLLGLGRRGNVADYVTAVKAAEELGYHSVWINDHVVIPTEHRSQYPYSTDGRPSFTPDDHFYDPFVLLAALATATTTIKLGTSVAVIPYRPPILTAKAIATLDQVSQGRFIFGVGVGWFAEETELLGGTFANRAKISRSYLETMKALWTEERPRLLGERGQTTEVGFAPKPVQKPYPPIWFGGETRAALKRVVQQGDGWFPAFVSPEQFATKAGELKQLCAEQGRDCSSITMCAFPANPAYFSLDAIHTFRQHGASILLAPVAHPQIDEFIARLRKFRDEVMRPAKAI